MQVITIVVVLLSWYFVPLFTESRRKQAEHGQRPPGALTPVGRCSFNGARDAQQDETSLSVHIVIGVQAEPIPDSGGCRAVLVLMGTPFQTQQGAQPLRRRVDAAKARKTQPFNDLGQPITYSVT